MDFITAVKTCLSSKFATFQGRASRSEYWFFTLFNVILSVIAAIMDEAVGSEIGAVSWILTVALLVPGIAVTVRRLHDLDRSGWWQLLYLIPVVGWIVMLVWLCTKGTVGPNRFGEDPLGGASFWETTPA